MGKARVAFGLPRTEHQGRSLWLRAILIALALLSIASVSYLVMWTADESRRGQDLSPAYARVIATDPNTTTDDRRLALHRLVKSLQVNIKAMHKAGQQDPAVHSYIQDSFAVVEAQMKRGN